MTCCSGSQFLESKSEEMPCRYSADLASSSAANLCRESVIRSRFTRTEPKGIPSGNWLACSVCVWEREPYQQPNAHELYVTEPNRVLDIDRQDKKNTDALIHSRIRWPSPCVVAKFKIQNLSHRTEILHAGGIKFRWNKQQIAYFACKLRDESNEHN